MENEKLKNINTISVDFDGVLMHLFMGKTWLNFKNNQNPKENLLGTVDVFMKVLGNWWMRIYHRMRRKIPGSRIALSKMKKAGKRIYLLTSRRNYLYPATKEWLKLRNVDEVFDGMFFRDNNTYPAVFKEKIIRIQNIDVHIDDDYHTVKYLSEKFPTKKFVYLNYYKKRSIDRENVYSVSKWSEITDLLLG